ncbi:MAG: FG-GAP-like repeat-containing protein, partial [Verrucomicrobiota bacterium]
MLKHPFISAFLIALVLGSPDTSAQVADLNLAAKDTGNVVEVSWTSESVTTNASFLHYEFHVEGSSDLKNWTNFGGTIAGGPLATRSVPHAIDIPKSAEIGFYRLGYRLNLSGSNLSGLNFSGADLRNANLTGANLTNANLSGADLSGAILSGANIFGVNLAGAVLAGVDLNGLDLAGLDMSQIGGTPLLAQLTADPSGNAAELLPHLPYNPDPSDTAVNDPDVPGFFASARDAIVMLKTNTTVGQLNALLAKYGATIVASSPKDAALENALLMLRFRTARVLELFEVTKQLTNETVVAVAAPDLLMQFGAIPDDSNGASGWQWDPADNPTGGNWGLEKARVPQMWNWIEPITKRGTGRAATAIIDGGFPSHTDLAFSLQLGATTPLPLGPEHGLPVAGIIGAKYGKGGIDGVNPFADLAGYTLGSLSGFATFDAVRSILLNVPNLKVVNLSFGLPGDLTKPLTSLELALLRTAVSVQGFFFAELARPSASVLFVCEAGNQRDLIPLSLSSAACYAALELGVDNILIVGSHGPSGNHSAFSNTGGHVEAPGELILSTTINNGYATVYGSSMATAFVTGLAGYLLAVDPTLTPHQLKTLLQSHLPNVDAFTSVMEIDNLAGRDREVLKMLLDIDDGYLDGSERVLVPPPTLAKDRSFETVTGPDYKDEDIDGDGGIGDGVIDMSDFRRWRDWLLFGEGHHALNGSPDHPKNDVNRDGKVDPRKETSHYPRGDFNGDGIMDRTARWPVPGWFENLEFTDLGVIHSSGLWEDKDYTNALYLVELIDSVDFTVFATNVFFKNATLPPANVSVRDADTKRPITSGAVIPFTEAEPEHVFTVPVGGKYFVSSDPIDIGGGTNVLLRSIGEHEGGLEIDVAADQAGADFAVDLCLVEMTALVEHQNPSGRVIDSQPEAEEVEAYLISNLSVTNAFANADATLYAMVSAGAGASTDPATPSTLTGTVRWQRSFIKDAKKKDPRYEVKPMVLRLGGSDPSGAELNAFAEIVLEMRAYDISPGWQPVFLYHAEIAGTAVPLGTPSTFRIVGQEGDLPDKTLTLNGVFGAEYVQEKHRGTIDLGGVQDGHSFELRYRLLAKVVGNPGADGEAFAYVGDPLHYGSGTRMEYGAFGELPRIDSFTLDNQGAAHLAYQSRTNFYYFLYRGTNVDTAGLPIAMKLGTAGSDELVDPTPPAGAGLDSYTLENQRIAQPLDVDADGIHDVYELLRPKILDPLDPGDTSEDPDADGFSNLAEFTNGTNPEVADAPTAPLLRFPGIIVPSYSGGELVDLNNDGILDLASRGGNTIFTALGQVGGIFTALTESAVLGARSLSDAAYFKLDGDVFPDAVTVDLLTNRLSVLRGLGDGRFVPFTNYPTMGDTRKVVFGDLNRDGIKDVAAMSSSGRGADLFLGVGDGTLTQLAPVSTNAFGLAQAVALGDFNGDLRDDVVVTYFGQAVVFLSQATGGYQPGQPYPVGGSPESIAIGDLNHDGHPDIIVANRSRDDLSVLLGAAGGNFLPEVCYPVGELPLGLRLADLNGDAFLDVVVSRVSAEYQTVFLNRGNGTLGTPYTVPTGSGGLAGILDWNGDGKLDFLSGIGRDGGLVNLGHGDGTFDTRLQIVPTNSPPTKVKPVDLNGDSRLELAGLNTQLKYVGLVTPDKKYYVGID